MEATDRAVSWRKSSFTGGNGTNCVEVGRAVDAVMVRDTKNRTGGMLAFTPNTWRRFLNTN